MRYDRSADTRGLLVLTHEVRKMTEAAERVRLVSEALAKRHGINPPEPEREYS